MNQTDILIAIGEMAQIKAPPIPKEEAIATLAAAIDRLDKAHASYETQVEALLRVGALVWSTPA